MAFCRSEEGMPVEVCSSVMRVIEVCLVVLCTANYFLPSRFMEMNFVPLLFRLKVICDMNSESDCAS